MLDLLQSFVRAGWGNGLTAFVIHNGDVDKLRYGRYEGKPGCAIVLHAKNMVSAARLYDKVGKRRYSRCQWSPLPSL